MLKKRCLKLQKRAFTLIEILLAIAILAVATVGIGSVIISTQNNSAKMFNEQELQQQLAEVQELLHNEALSTNAGISYWVKAGDGAQFEQRDKDLGSESEKLIAFYNLDVKDFVLTKTYYRYNAKERIIEMGTAQETITKDSKNETILTVDSDINYVLATIDNWSTIATNVETFNVNVSTYKTNKLISFGFEIEQEGRSYPSDDTIFIRNDIQVNEALHLEKYHIVKLPKPTLVVDDFPYNGQTHSPTEADFLERYMVRSEDSVTSAIHAGTYTITYVLKDKDATQWEDGSTSDVTVTWRINKKVVKLNWGQTSWVYDGNVHEVTCTTSDLVAGDVCNVVFQNGENKIGPNVGEKVCHAYLDNPDYTLPLVSTVTLKITPETPKANISVTPRVYNDGNQDMVSCAALPSNNVNFQGSIYYYISTSTATPTKAQVKSTTCKAKNANTYFIWYWIDSTTPNYVDTDVIYLGQVLMDRRPNASYIVNNSLVYNTKPQQGVTGNGIVFVSGQYATNAGTHTTQIKPDDNHYWDPSIRSNNSTVTLSVTWTLNKADVSVTAPTARTGLIYNGANQVLINAGSTPNGTMMYSLNGTDFATALPSAVNANTYTVYYYSTGDSNYKQSPTRTISVTIDRKQAATVTTQNVQYTGGTISGVSTKYVTTSGPTSAITVGTYTFTATPTSNYYWSDAKNYTTRTFSWNITQKPASVTKAPKANSLTYNGKAQALVTAGTTPNGSMQYRLSTSDAWSTTIPTRTDAGTYTVYYRSSGDHNHYAAGYGSVSVTIARNRSATASAANKTYNGNTQTGVTGSYVSWSGTTSAKDWKSSGYTAYATPTSNYAWSNGGTERRTITWYINKLNTATAAKANKTYNGKTQTGVKGSNVSWTGQTTGKNAGGYTAYATPTNNYAWSDGTYGQRTITWTMNKAAGSCTAPTAKSLTYNGSAQTLINAGSTSYGSMYYNVDGGGYSTSRPKGTNAKSYTVGYYSSGDANHNATSAKTITVTIGRAWSATASGVNRTYNGKAQTGVTGSNVDWSGTTSATNYSSRAYTAYATPKSNYCWSNNGGTERRTITWTMSKASGSCTAPTARSLTYNGSAQTLINAGSTSYGSMYYNVDGGSYSTSLPKGTNAKAYTVGYYSSGDSNHNATSAKTITVYINRAWSASAGRNWPTFNGNNLTGVWGNYVNWSGTTAAVSPNTTYYAYATPQSNYCWSDNGGTEQRTITWSIARAAWGWCSGSNPTFTGESVSGVSGGCVNWSGTTSAVSAGGPYYAYATLCSNISWSDTGGTEVRTVTWYINRAAWGWASGGTYDYTGGAITGVSGGCVNWSGTTSATSPGPYTAYATLCPNISWSDTGGTEVRTINWTIKGYVFTRNAVIYTSSGAKQYSDSGAACGQYNAVGTFTANKQYWVYDVYNINTGKWGGSCTPDQKSYMAVCVMSKYNGNGNNIVCWANAGQLYQ